MMVLLRKIVFFDFMVNGFVVLISFKIIVIKSHSGEFSHMQTLFFTFTDNGALRFLDL